MLLGTTEIIILFSLLGIIMFFILALIFLVKYFKTRPKEIILDKSNVNPKVLWLKKAIVILGFGLGLLIIGILNELNLLNSTPIRLGILLIFLSISMIIAQQFDKKDSIEE